MGTHLEKNGYYILEKRAPILYAIGYPFLDKIVLFGIKYSGEIKTTDYRKSQTCEYQYISLLQKIHFVQQKILMSYVCKPKMQIKCLITNVKNRFIAILLQQCFNRIAATM